MKPWPRLIVRPERFKLRSECYHSYQIACAKHAGWLQIDGRALIFTSSQDCSLVDPRFNFQDLQTCCSRIPYSNLFRLLQGSMHAPTACMKSLALAGTRLCTQVLHTSAPRQIRYSIAAFLAMVTYCFAVLSFPSSGLTMLQKSSWTSHARVLTKRVSNEETCLF